MARPDLPPASRDERARLQHRLREIEVPLRERAEAGLLSQNDWAEGMNAITMQELDNEARSIRERLGEPADPPKGSTSRRALSLLRMLRWLGILLIVIGTVSAVVEARSGAPITGAILSLASGFVVVVAVSDTLRRNAQQQGHKQQAE